MVQQIIELFKKKKTNKLIEYHTDIQENLNQNSDKYKTATFVLDKLSKEQCILGYISLQKLALALQSKIIGFNKNDDGRTDSSNNEGSIYEIIDKIVNNNQLNTENYMVKFYVAKSRHWYDFTLVFVNIQTGLIEFIYPVNLKNSSESGNDNACPKEVPYYTITGKDPILLPNNQWDTWDTEFLKNSSIILEDNLEHYSDYGILIATKKDYKNTKCTSYRQLKTEHLKPNGNNMFCQINWKNIPAISLENTFFTLDNNKEFIKKMLRVMYLSTVQRKSVCDDLIRSFKTLQPDLEYYC